MHAVRRGQQRGVPPSQQPSALTRGAGDVASPAEAVGSLAQLLRVRRDHGVHAAAGIRGHRGQHMRGMAQALKRLAAAAQPGDRGEWRGSRVGGGQQCAGSGSAACSRQPCTVMQARYAGTGPAIAAAKVANASAHQDRGPGGRLGGRALRSAAHLRVSHSVGSKWWVTIPRWASRSHFSWVRHVPATSQPRCWKKRAAPAGDGPAGLRAPHVAAGLHASVVPKRHRAGQVAVGEP